MTYSPLLWVVKSQAFRKNDGYLKRFVDMYDLNNKIGSSTEPAIMWAGDVNNDGAIGMADVMKIAEGFNTIPGSPKYNQVCDLNKDNAITMADVMITGQHFNSSSSSYPQDVLRP